jgi:CheY-like chemotaxis protein
MSTPKHTIVYAEDDLDDLFIVRQAFEKHDHINMVHAEDGRKAMHILEKMAVEKSLPCLVILDINMPVMNGREVLQAIRNHGQLNRLPVVLFSTSSSANDKVFAERHDAFLITKPVDFANLEVIVEQFIERCNFEVNNVVANSEYLNL